MTPGITDAELRALMIDCLELWRIDARVSANDDGMTINTRDGDFLLQRATSSMRPVRWLLQTPERSAAHRPPRATPSIVALLTALRNALGTDERNSLRIGASAP